MIALPIVQFDPNHRFDIKNVSEFSALYKLASFTLAHCAKHVPAEDEMLTAQFIDVENMCHDFQDRILETALSLELNDVDDVKAILSLWRLVNPSLPHDLSGQERLILKVSDEFGSVDCAH